MFAERLSVGITSVCGIIWGVGTGVGVCDGIGIMEANGGLLLFDFDATKRGIPLGIMTNTPKR